MARLRIAGAPPRDRHARCKAAITGPTPLQELTERILGRAADDLIASSIADSAGSANAKSMTGVPLAMVGCTGVLRTLIGAPDREWPRMKGQTPTRRSPCHANTIGASWALAWPTAAAIIIGWRKGLSSAALRTRSSHCCCNDESRRTGDLHADTRRAPDQIGLAFQCEERLPFNTNRNCSGRIIEWLDVLHRAGLPVPRHSEPWRRGQRLCAITVNEGCRDNVPRRRFGIGEPRLMQ